MQTTAGTHTKTLSRRGTEIAETHLLNIFNLRASAPPRLRASARFNLSFLFFPALDKLRLETYTTPMMDQFLLARSSGKAADELLINCLNQLGDIPPEANFGFLYLSDHLADSAESILARLKQATDIENWVGSVGIGIIANETEYYDEPAMAIMLAGFNEADFHILPNFCTDTAALSGELGDWCNANDFNVGLLHADPTNPATQT
jgi:hypothetical protein